MLVSIFGNLCIGQQSCVGPSWDLFAGSYSHKNKETQLHSVWTPRTKHLPNDHEAEWTWIWRSTWPVPSKDWNNYEYNGCKKVLQLLEHLNKCKGEFTVISTLCIFSESLCMYFTAMALSSSGERRSYDVLSPVEYISNLCDSTHTVTWKLLWKVQIVLPMFKVLLVII